MVTAALAACSAPAHAADLPNDGANSQRPVDSISQTDFDKRYSGWHDGLVVDVALGAIVQPAFTGSDDYQTSAIPNIRVNYRDIFFASIDEGIGLNAINWRGIKAGPVVNYDPGRDEDSSGLLSFGGENKDLIDLGKIDGSVEVGGFLEYEYRNFGAKLEVRQGIGGHEGLIGEASLSYGDKFTIGQLPVMWSFGPHAMFADENYNDAFFGIDAAQSAASGLSQFDAGVGLVSYGVGANIIVPLSEKVAIVGFGEFDRLTGDAADSPLVKERGSENQATFGMMLNYRFE
ncbi:MipA/OmpV family protein [Labrenzia sp. CE80]|uniref:MipA/OmpV family protein n=1 Tax=Labrenzia sp. CE80 TaxID=1788986 RepID=UPI00138996BD|nr:MipA/OmpV family protein [Labrenzia sp. CE80]